MSYLEEHYDDIFKKYTDYDLLCDVRNYIDGEGKLYKTLRHFFDEIMFECKGPKGNLTPIEVLRNDNTVKDIIETTKSNPKIYDRNSEVGNIRAFLSMDNRITSRVYNFDPRVARDLYFRYFPEYKDALKRDSLPRLNCLDTSCGFGGRMSAVLLSGMNYYGTDPNKKLYGVLQEYYDFLKRLSIVEDEQVCDIRCQGSEEFISEWIDKMDVMFTSPPYWKAEYYSDDKCASTENYDNYKNWLRYFIVPTVMNIRKYLKTGGYLMINIRNRGEVKLFDDIKSIISNIGGFELIETFEVRTGSRKRFNQTHAYGENNIDAIEPVMSFRKII